MNNYFTITVSVFGEDLETQTFNVDITDSTCTLDEVKSIVIEAYNEAMQEVEGFEPITELDEENYDIDWGNVPEWAQDWSVLDDLMPEFSSSSNDIEIFEAAHKCGIQFSDVDEAYNGSFRDDETFVQDLLEQTGGIPKDFPPYIHIDWESTSRDVMMDYSESNGHYFRNL